MIPAQKWQYGVPGQAGQGYGSTMPPPAPPPSAGMGQGQSNYFQKYGQPQQPQAPQAGGHPGASPGFKANPYGASTQDAYGQFLKEQGKITGQPGYAQGWGQSAWNLPPWMLASGSTVGLEGAAQMAKLFQDPYSLPQGMLRDSMQGTENAYQTARQRIGNDTLGSGAAEGGVAHGMRGNAELARGQGMADNLRQYDQFRTSLGDERMRSLWLPYQQMFQQGHQEQAPKGPSDSQQWLTTAATIASMFCWVAREVYGADSREWKLARHYILRLAPPGLREWYGARGPAVAEQARRSPALRAALRPVFDRFVALAEADLAAAA